MDKSRVAKCCICHHTTDWFYDDVSLLQSKHSQRSIPVILKVIMGKELAQNWTPSDPMCVECVNKINDYDEAYEKMQSIELELTQIYQNIKVKYETEDGTVYGACTAAGASERDSEQLDANSTSKNVRDLLHERYRIKRFCFNIDVIIFSLFDQAQSGV